MTDSKIETSKTSTEQRSSKRSVSAGKHPARNRENADDFASYAFDMLQSLREASTRERHAFLRYLMGLAAEEAIRLSEGHSSSIATYNMPPK